MAYPVHSVTLPADLVGAQNGKLTTQLVLVAFPGRGNLKVHSQFARAWKALWAECLAATGVTLTAVSGGDAYRPYDQQVTLFMQRYTTTPVPGTTSIKQWNGQTWYLKIGNAMAAVPGMSNHGLGLALDVAEWFNGFVHGISGSKAWAWLLANAESFGFSWEAQSEPWHTRLFVGDKPTQRVLDFEAPVPTPPTPTPPVYDEDMGTLYRDKRYWNVFLVNGDVTTVGPALNESLIARGVVQVADVHDQSLVSYMRKSQIKMAQMVPSNTPGGTAPDVPVFSPPGDLA